MRKTRPARPESRPIAQHVSMLAPGLLRPLLFASLRVPHEAWRHALVMRGLRDADRAFNRGDLEAAFAGLSPNVEYELPREFPGSGLLRGRAAVLAYYQGEWRQWTKMHLWHDTVLAADPAGLSADYGLRFEGGASGIALELHGTQTLEVERSEIVRVRTSVDRSRALDRV